MEQKQKFKSNNKYNYGRTLLNNNERDNLYERPTQRNQTLIYKNDYQKDEPKKRYETRSVSTATYNRGIKKIWSTNRNHWVK